LKNNKILVIILWILLMAAISVAPVLAAGNPDGCSQTGVGLSIGAYQDAGATIPAIAVESGQTIYYKATLSWLGGANCYFQYGTWSITTPDNVVHDVTPGGGVPLIGLSLDSVAVPYTVRKIDVSGGTLYARTDYNGGTSWLGESGITPVGAYTPYYNQYQEINLQVEKTATPAIQQGYTWTIDKSVTPTSWNFNNGDSGMSEYTIAVVKTLSGTVYTVSGTITITNPSAFVSAHITGVTDGISPSTVATVDCGGFPFDIAPLGHKDCTYTATLPDSTTQTNTADVATTGDIGGGSGTAPVDFTGVTPTIINGEIDVEDTNPGVGPWHFTDSDSVNYNKIFDCSGMIYDASGHASKCYPNTATITGTALSDDAEVCVDCYKPPTPKLPKVCVKHRLLCLTPDCGADPYGASINTLQYRTGLYMFAGETLQYYIAVRDTNGPLDIESVQINIGDHGAVLCNEITSFPEILPDHDMTCNGFGELLTEGPGATDKLFECTLTALMGSEEGGLYGEYPVTIVVYNVMDESTVASHVEDWFFNPSLSLSVDTSDGKIITFGGISYLAKTPDQRTVHSTNRLIVQNTAEGGVNMWTYLAGTDLYDPRGVAKCPTTNRLDITNMQYRGYTGTQWTSWEGWMPMTKFNQNGDCSLEDQRCYGGSPVPYDDNAPLSQYTQNILTNQGKLEVEFKLTYPMPCVGTFTEGSIMVFGKAI
jgi:hypothetical protein